MAKRGARWTDGHRALEQVLKEHTQAEIAELLGVSQQVVSYWKHGHGRPRAEVRWALEQYFRIPQVSWLTKSELRLRRAA